MKTAASTWQVYQWDAEPLVCRKFESILCQGNGYMGVRAATEEDGEKTVRYTLVAGTFDRMHSKNTNELPNAAVPAEPRLEADRITAGCELTLNEGQTVELTKLCRIATTQDNDFSCGDDGERDALIRREQEQMAQLRSQGYEDAFTNYLAHMNLKLAATWCERLQREYPADYKRLAKKLTLQSQRWQTMADKLVLPVAGQIDLGPNLKSSDEGIHAASLGGVWQCCVLGYAGVRLCGEELRIAPNLPESWQSVTAKIWWRGSHLEITATHQDVTVRVLEGPTHLQALTDSGLLRGERELNWNL